MMIHLNIMKSETCRSEEPSSPTSSYRLQSFLITAFQKSRYSQLGRGRCTSSSLVGAMQLQSMSTTQNKQELQPVRQLSMRSTVGPVLAHHGFTSTNVRGLVFLTSGNAQPTICSTFRQRSQYSSGLESKISFRPTVISRHRFTYQRKAHPSASVTV
jgi:hypothetical protein